MAAKGPLQIQVLATNGNTRLGGDDLDRRLVEFLTAKIQVAGDAQLVAQLETRNPKPSGTLPSSGASRTSG